MSTQSFLKECNFELEQILNLNKKLATGGEGVTRWCVCVYYCRTYDKAVCGGGEQ